MSLDTTVVKTEFTIGDDVDIKGEELEADVLEVPLQGFEADLVEVPVQTFEAQLEFEGVQMEEPYFDSEGCRELTGLGTKRAQVEVILDAKEPLCVFSEVATLADQCVEELVSKRRCTKEEKYIWSKGEATRAGPLTTDIRRQQHVLEVNTNKILAPTSEGNMEDENSCTMCHKRTMQSYKVCTECEKARAYQQLSGLYVHQKKREKTLLISKHSNSDEAKLQALGGRPMNYAKNLYPTIRNCWVQLERCPAAEEALQLRSTIKISRLTIINANSHTKKPYYCKVCKTNVMTPLDKFCTICHMKNLKHRDCSVSLERCEKAKTAQFTKNFKSIFNTNESYVSEKSYSCEMCNVNITITGDFRKNRRFCRDCELEQATNQLRNVINFRFYCHLCKKDFQNLNLLNDHRKNHATSY